MNILALSITSFDPATIAKLFFGTAKTESATGTNCEVKELSTPSHEVRRAEERIKTDPSFRQHLDRGFKLLGHSPIQA